MSLPRARPPPSSIASASPGPTRRAPSPAQKVYSCFILVESKIKAIIV